METNDEHATSHFTQIMKRYDHTRKKIEVRSKLEMHGNCFKPKNQFEVDAIKEAEKERAIKSGNY